MAYPLNNQKKRKLSISSVSSRINRSFAKVRILQAKLPYTHKKEPLHTQSASSTPYPSALPTPAPTPAPFESVRIVRRPSKLARTVSKLRAVLKRSKACKFIFLSGDPPSFYDNGVLLQSGLSLHIPPGQHRQQSSSAMTVFRSRRRHPVEVPVKLVISNYDGEYDPAALLAPPSNSSLNDRRDLRPCKSSPSLSRQIRRMSTVLTTNTQTIIHKPSNASRPTVLVGGDEQNSFTPSPPFGPVENSGRSSVTSFFRSGTASAPLSPGSGISSAPTSFFSSRDSQNNGTSIRPGTSSGINAGLPTISETQTTFLGMLTPDDVTPNEVSIATVERASAAKVFMETFYSQVYQSEEDEPRSARRRLFEKKLYDSSLSLGARQGERFRFFQAETDHLRLTRALKSKGTGPSDKLSVANYEVTRILGKGSFGVVKLVREKSLKVGITIIGSTEESSTPPTTPIESLENSADIAPKRRSSRMDLEELKKTVYAMKVIRKSDMLRNSQEGHLRAERDFLVASINSQWVVPLIASFQDSNSLYLVMEYMVGGDFLGLLLREDVLPEWAAKWYIAQMVLCLEEAHKMKWIHRDVKPDNFLISASGHLKISDFGLAFDGHWAHHQQYYNATRESLCQTLGVEVAGDSEDIAKEIEKVSARNLANAVGGRPFVAASDSATTISRPEGNMVIDKLNSGWKRKFAKSVVGTSQYMAPEVIRGELYDGRCDWWSIGIILYECLYGRTPFYCETRDDTKKRILEHKRNLAFPHYSRYHRPQSGNASPLDPVSPHAISLIAALLTDKESRLSCRRYRENDPPRVRRPGSRTTRMMSSSPHFICPDDAEDIKLHPFFEDVVWDEMHSSQPPWIPTIKRDQSIAKWFEDESEIIGTSFEEVRSSDQDLATTDSTPIGTAITTESAVQLQSQLQLQLNDAPLPLDGACTSKGSKSSTPKNFVMPAISVPFRGPSLLAQNLSTNPTKSKKNPTESKKKPTKERKRPRDKILRDPIAGPTALAERKAKAFLGYTYRRPDVFVLSCAPEERIGRMCMRGGRPSVYGIVGGASG